MTNGLVYGGHYTNQQNEALQVAIHTSLDALFSETDNTLIKKDYFPIFLRLENNQFPSDDLSILTNKKILRADSQQRIELENLLIESEQDLLSSHIREKINALKVLLEFDKHQDEKNEVGVRRLIETIMVSKNKYHMTVQEYYREKFSDAYLRNFIRGLDDDYFFTSEATLFQAILKKIKKESNTEELGEKNKNSQYLDYCKCHGMLTKKYNELLTITANQSFIFQTTTSLLIESAWVGLAYFLAPYASAFGAGLYNNAVTLKPVSEGSSQFLTHVSCFILMMPALIPGFNDTFKLSNAREFIIEDNVRRKSIQWLSLFIASYEDKYEREIHMDAISTALDTAIRRISPLPRLYKKGAISWVDFHIPFSTINKNEFMLDVLQILDLPEDD